MIKLLTRYDAGKLQICCVATDETHIWVDVFDLFDYMEQETVRIMGRKEKIEDKKDER